MRRDCTKVLRGDHLAFAVWPYSVLYGLTLGEILHALRAVYKMDGRVSYRFVSAVDGKSIFLEWLRMEPWT